MGRLRILNESGDTCQEFSDPVALEAANELLHKYLRAGHLALDRTTKKQITHTGRLDPESDVIVVPEIRVG